MQPKDAEIDQPPSEIQALAERLNQGEVIAFPTETFYGLMARVDRPAALRKVFAIKGRLPERALPVIASNKAVARLLWSACPPEALQLMDAFWPGPLTIVLPARLSVDMLITGGSDTVGVRVPGLAEARELAALAGGALVATSANPADEPPARSCDELDAYFGGEVECWDAGEMPPSKGSTVLQMVDWPPLILREGEISREQLAAVLGIDPALRS
jgi:L-threonylcarbamoyladenylate synthase